MDKAPEEVDPLTVEKVTPEKAAELLGCSRAKVYRLLAGGTLRGWKVGRATLVDMESIREALQPIVPKQKPKVHRETASQRRRADAWARKILKDAGALLD